MKKKLTTFILSTFLIVFYMSFQAKFSITPIDHFKVQNTTAYISQDKFKGRLAGTIENAVIAQYIKNDFKNSGLQPFFGTYYETFPIKYPKKLEGTPYLRVIDSEGNIIKNYIYGSDYKEDMINFKANKFTFDKNNIILDKTTYLHINKGNNTFLFYTPNDNNLDFRSSFINDSEQSMYIMVTKEILKDIKSNISNGNRISCFIPYSVKSTSINNVIGCIEGKNKTLPPLILSAHFDHVGTDLNNKIYNGALDNASGTAFILALNNYVKSLGKPERTILFIGFNAEEFGCLGSNNFVNRHHTYLKGAKVFNFDMIGSNNSIPLCIMGGKKDNVSTPFITSIASTCSKEKIYFNYLFADCSDHNFFRKKDIDAITFCDNDMSKIHTTKDKCNTTSTFGIDRCFKVVSKEIIKYGFNNNPLLIYYNKFFIISFIGTILFSGLYRIQK